MDVLYNIFIDPFLQMAAARDLMLYALIALGFVPIFKASVFNFAQGIMMVFADFPFGVKSVLGDDAAPPGCYGIGRSWGEPSESGRLRHGDGGRDGATDRHRRAPRVGYAHADRVEILVRRGGVKGTHTEDKPPFV